MRNARPCEGTHLRGELPSPFACNSPVARMSVATSGTVLETPRVSLRSPGLLTRHCERSDDAWFDRSAWPLQRSTVDAGPGKVEMRQDRRRDIDDAAWRVANGTGRKTRA